MVVLEHLFFSNKVELVQVRSDVILRKKTTLKILIWKKTLLQKKIIVKIAFFKQSRKVFLYI